MKNKMKKSTADNENTKKVKLSEMPKIVKAEFLLPIIGVLFFIKPLIENDVWFILNCGRYITQNGLPHTEVFTIHEGLNTIMQQWLFDVLTWRIYSVLGDIGMTLFLGVMFFVIASLIYSLCRKVSNNNHFVSAMTTLICMCFTVSGFFTVRPQTFTIMIILCVLNLLESYSTSGNYKYLLPIPLLSILEINIHASMWPLIFITMLPFIVDTFNFDFKLIKCAGIKKLPLYITFAVSAVVGFINPYGLDAVMYLPKSYMPILKNMISEMQLLDVSTPDGFATAFAAILLIALIFLRLGQKKASVPIRYILLVVGYSYMSFMTVRNEMFLYAAALFAFAYIFKDFDPEVAISQGSENKKKNAVLSVILIVAIIGGVAVYFVTEPSDSSEVRFGEYSDCEEIVSYMDENYKDKDNIKVYTGYNDGTYLEYMGYRVYLDARAELFAKKNNGKEDILTEYMKIQYGTTNVNAFLDKYDFDLLVVSQSDALYYKLPDDKDYKKVYSDKKRTLYQNVNMEQAKIK